MNSKYKRDLHGIGSHAIDLSLPNNFLIALRHRQGSPRISNLCLDITLKKDFLPYFLLTAKNMVIYKLQFTGCFHLF